MTGKEIVRILKGYGWTLDRINGSHHIMTKEGFRPVPVPVHAGRDVPKGLVSALERQTRTTLSKG